MRAVIKRWGNSLALRIPKHLAEEAGLEEDSEVEVEARAGKIVAKKTSKELKLEDLLSQLTEDNRQPLIDFGPPAGKEYKI